MGWIDHEGVPALYTRVIEGEICVLLLYVDDMLFCCPEKFTEVLRREVADAFELRDHASTSDGPVVFIGLSISRMPTGEYQLMQVDYITHLLREYERNYGSIRPRTCIPVYKEGVGDDSPLFTGDDKGLSPSHWIGALMYAARGTRVDLLHATVRLARVVSRWTDNHADRLRELFQYIKQYPDVRVTVGFPSSISPKLKSLSFHVFVDSDYAGACDRYSYSGVTCAVAHPDTDRIISVLHWHSRRQKTIALSSTEAEIGGAVDGVRGSDECYNVLRALSYNISYFLRPDNDPARIAIARG